MNAYSAVTPLPSTKGVPSEDDTPAAINGALESLIARNLERLIQRSGMTKLEISHQIGMNNAHLGKIVKGTYRLPASRLAMLAAVLNVPITDFFEGIEEVLNP